MSRPLAIATLLLAFTVEGCVSTGAPIREQDALHRAPHPTWIITTGGVIYVPPGTLATYTSPTPTAAVSAVLAHERVHAARQVERGGLEWSVLYATSASFRWDEERRAYEAELAEMARTGSALASPWWRERFVGLVVDPAYRGMVERADAERWYDAFVASLRPTSAAPALARPVHACRLGCSGKCCNRCDDRDRCCCRDLDRCPCPPDSRRP